MSDNIYFEKLLIVTIFPRCELQQSVQSADGKLLTELSLFLPAAEEDPSVAEKHFYGKQNSAAVCAAAKQLPTDLEFY